MTSVEGRKGVEGRCHSVRFSNLVSRLLVLLLNFAVTLWEI
jgi:hypothetical protein